MTKPVALTLTHRIKVYKHDYKTGNALERNNKNLEILCGSTRKPKTRVEY